MCWMKVWSRSNFSSNSFSFIQHIFCHFSCWMRLTTFFIQQYVKIMPFYCNLKSYQISKIWISIRKQNKSCFVCQITLQHLHVRLPDNSPTDNSPTGQFPDQTIPRLNWTNFFFVKIAFNNGYNFFLLF